MSRSYSNHLESYESLITPYKEIRAGFISIALEKNKKATPFILEAKALKAIAENAKNPKELLNFDEIKTSLYTASGISEKALKHLQDEDKREAVVNLIEEFLEPSGSSFVDELIYRFLLTRGDTLGGRMRNFAGRVGEWKFTRLLISTLSVCGRTFQYSDSVSPKWLESENEVDLEKRIKGIHWFSGGKPRTLLYNKKVPLIRKNVDLCLFDCLPEELKAAKNINPSYQPEKYLALGELKGGIDPGGADEHWKTANSALNRIREGFANKNCHPYTFFIGAAIAKAMAKEIYRQLEDATLANGANLTHDKQTISLCTWLINL